MCTYMFKIRNGIVYVLAAGLLMGCEYIQRRQMGDAVVTVNGQSLHESDLYAVTAGARSAEDSVRLADEYIRRWATNILLYDKAKRSSEQADAIEQMVEDYRRTLYVHEYEQGLVDKRMPKEVDDEAIESFYKQHSDRFVLREDIVRGMLVVLPSDAPKVGELRGWMGDLTDEHLEKIEKYAYQYATSYELFSDQWQTMHEVMLRMGVSSKDKEQEMRHNQLVENSDSTHIYLLRVTERHLQGEAMPVDYAHGEIVKALLNQRQVQFLQKQRDEMYQQALRMKKVVFNDKIQNDKIQNEKIENDETE